MSRHPYLLSNHPPQREKWLLVQGRQQLLCCSEYFPPLLATHHVRLRPAAQFEILAGQYAGVIETVDYQSSIRVRASSP
jgi:hypothetical protein